MAETKDRCCGSCIHFKHECSTGEGICEAPIPKWVITLFTCEPSVTCDFGSDCNAYHVKEERIDHDR